jgi:hypothetical protein
VEKENGSASANLKHRVIHSIVIGFVRVISNVDDKVIHDCAIITNLSCQSVQHIWMHEVEVEGCRLEHQQLVSFC